MIHEQRENAIDRGYRKLEVYVLAHELAVKVHQMTMSLPKFELHEEGSQIRRSAKSVSANIVEGYSKLNAMLFNFLRAIENSHEKPLYLQESAGEYETGRPDS